MEAKFGREVSPVLYINPPYWENQSSHFVDILEGPGRRNDDCIVMRVIVV